MRPDRVAIWSVLEEDQRWYAWLFPGLWLLGTLYHAYLRFVTRPDEILILAGSEFIKDIGIVGLASAILSLMTIAARRLFMALFDWGNRDKTRAEARAKARAENNKRWEAWLARKEAAEKAGREFTEPSPAEETVQVA